MKTAFTIYATDADGEEYEISLPSRWAICDACRGDGTTTRHIECDGGGFTASEWNEACHDDPDFADDYRSGVYDRACPDCDGSGKVQEIDDERLTDEQRAAYEAEAEAERFCRAERDAERRYFGGFGY